MARKQAQELTVPNTQVTENPVTELTVPTKMQPAAVVGISTKVEIDQALLPEEFQGATLEVLESGFAPTVKWNEVGDYAAGIYKGFSEGVGKNNATLYEFETKNGKPFAIWGSTVLDRTFREALDRGQLKPGYLTLVTFVGEIPSKQNNDTMIFQIAVVKR